MVGNIVHVILMREYNEQYSVGYFKEGKMLEIFLQCVLYILKEGKWWEIYYGVY